MASTSNVVMPQWACVTEKRLGHIERVTALLDEWSARLSLGAAEARAWHDAGVFHDALRDAPESTLRELAGSNPDYAVEMLHGPAAAERLRQDGETRQELL